MIITLFEIEQEEAEMQEWTSDDNIENVPMIDFSKLSYLLENPPTRCEEKEDCASYNLSGNRCRCIRTIFPHESHYEIYIIMAEDKIKSELSHCFNQTDETETIEENSHN